MLVECHYQTLDRDSLTFVSTSLPVTVKDENLCPQHELIHCFVPSRNGTQLQTICKDDSYDFNLQETRDLPYRVEIKPVGACWEAGLESGWGGRMGAHHC